MSGTHRIGLISDTHGLVRTTVHEALAGVELILHAGDVVGRAVLDELATIAAVLAVPGNCDDPWDPLLREPLVVGIGGVPVRVTHGHELGAPTAAGLLARYTEPVIVFGHTHRPIVHRSGGRLVVNPGSAGPRRFRLGPSLAILTISGATPEVEIVHL